MAVSLGAQALCSGICGKDVAMSIVAPIAGDCWSAPGVANCPMVERNSNGSQAKLSSQKEPGLWNRTNSSGQPSASHQLITWLPFY